MSQSEPERARESQREPDSEPERARVSQREPERARESQREPDSETERARERHGGYEPTLHFIVPLPWTCS